MAICWEAGVTRARRPECVGGGGTTASWLTRMNAGMNGKKNFARVLVSKESVVKVAVREGGGV